MNNTPIKATVTLRFQVTLPGDHVKAAAVVSRIREDFRAYLVEAPDMDVTRSQRPSILAVGHDAGKPENLSFVYQEGTHPDRLFDRDSMRPFADA